LSQAVEPRLTDLVFDLDVYRVKKNADSKGPWDCYAPIHKIPAAEAFLPVNVAVYGGG
jgi:hypothetical protein